MLEVGFSDDHRPVDTGDAGSGRVLNTFCHGCWRAGGILNVEKLQGFKLRLENGRLVVGVPCVMGEVPPVAL